MPSYNLIRKMNLGDLASPEEARKNLRNGQLDTQNADNVLFTGGSIAVDTLVFNKKLPSSEPTPDLTGSYIVSKDDIGTADWQHYFPAAPWARNSASDISIRSFHQDLSLLLGDSLCNFAFHGTFASLEGKPTIDQIIPDEKKEGLLKSECNLQEFVDEYGRFDSNVLKDIFGIRALAFETYEDTTIRDVTVKNNFHIFGNSNQIDSLLRSKSYDIDTGEFNTISTEWYNPFYDDENNIRDIWVLLDSYKDPSMTNATTARALSNMYVHLDEVRRRQQGDFDQDLVRDTLTEMMREGEFVSALSNFSEPGLDGEICRQHLGIGNVAALGGTMGGGGSSSPSFTTGSLSISTSLTHIEASTTFSTFPTTDTYRLLYYCVGTDGELGLRPIPDASDNGSGIIRLSSNLFSSAAPHHSDYTASNCVVTSSSLSNLYATMVSNIDAINSSIYTQLSQFGNYDADENVFLDRDLSQFSNALYYQDMARQNLKLAMISYDDNYYNLDAYPTTTHSFSNDIGALMKHNNLSEFDDVQRSDCRTTLGLGTMAVNSRDGFHIVNGVATLKHVVANNLKLPGSLDPSMSMGDLADTWLKYVHEPNNSHAILTRLLRATTDSRGLVRRLDDTYETADYEAVISASNLKTMYDNFMTRLEAMEGIMDQLENGRTT
jgi:hypothetical protein